MCNQRHLPFITGGIIDNRARGGICNGQLDVVITVEYTVNEIHRESMVFDGITWIDTTHRVLRHTGQDIGAQELDIDTCHFENQSTDVVRQIDFFVVVPCCTLRLVVIVCHGVDSENALREIVVAHIDFLRFLRIETRDRG